MPERQVDVLVLTAIRLEYDAVRDVDEGAAEGTTWEECVGPANLLVSFRDFKTTAGDLLRVAVTYALEMGGIAAANAAVPLLQYNPSCIAMSGVCAGRRGKVELGDVLIANQLWQYDAGKTVAEKDDLGVTKNRFFGKTLTYQLDPGWQQRAEAFQPQYDSLWLSRRPRPLATQADWILERLLRSEDPKQHPDREKNCPQPAAAIEWLWTKGWLLSGELVLSEAGRRRASELQNKHWSGLPDPPEFMVHVAPIGTGTQVIEDPQIFGKLSIVMRDVLGLEMEAVAVGAVAHLHDKKHLVMKGVMDFADGEKDDQFKEFAARASAECLLKFLRENFHDGPRDHHLLRLVTLVERASEAGDYADAERLARQATDLVSTTTTPELAWKVWQERIVVATDIAQNVSGDPQRLENLDHLIVQLEEIASKCPKNSRVQVGTRIHRAAWATDVGKFGVADELLAEARDIADHSGDSNLREIALIQSGRYYACVHLADKLQGVIKAGESIRSRGGPWADAWANLDASLAMMSGDADQAEAAFWRAIRANNKGRLVPEAYSHRCAAAEYMAGRDLHDRAIKFCKFSSGDGRLPSDNRLAIRLSIAEASSCLALRDATTAESIFLQIAELTHSQLPYFHGMAQFGIADISIERGEYSVGRRHAEMACRAFLAAGAVDMAARVTGLTAYSWLHESPAKAETAYQMAIRLAESIGEPARRLAVSLRVDLVCNAQFAGRSSEELVRLADEVARVPDLTPSEVKRVHAVRDIAVASSQVAQTIEALAETSVSSPRAESADLRREIARGLNPLLTWLRNYPKAPKHEVLLDAWGRGSFSVLAAKLRHDSLATKLTVNVTSADDIRRAVRMLAPIADCVVLLWRGNLDSRFEHDLWVPAPWLDVDGPPGGHGYGIWRDIDMAATEEASRLARAALGADAVLRAPPLFPGEKIGLLTAKGYNAKYEGVEVSWFRAGGYGNYLPRDVAEVFLVELLPLVEIGRVVLLPGNVVGCPSVNHDFFERSFHTALGAWAVDGISASSDLAPNIRPNLVTPWLPEIAWGDLASLIADEEESLDELRSLVWQYSREVSEHGPDGVDAAAREFRERARSGLARVERRFRRLRDAVGPVAETELLGSASRTGADDRIWNDRNAPAAGSMSELARLSGDGHWYWMWKARGLTSRFDFAKLAVDRALKIRSPELDDEDTRRRIFAHWLVPATSGWAIRRQLRV